MGTKALGSLLAWLREAPPGTSVDAATVADRIDELVNAPNSRPIDAATWREKLWTAPDEARIGRSELLEAIGRTESWLYRHTSPKCECARIPHRKLDGELVFVVGEVRQWLVDHEEIVVPGRPLGECATRSRPFGVLHKSIA